MAIGFSTGKCEGSSFISINDPAFVFTSPNIPDNSPAGTRSHVVPEEMDLGLWLESSSLDKMYRFMVDQSTVIIDGNLTTYDYSTSLCNVYTLAAPVSSTTTKTYLHECLEETFKGVTYITFCRENSLDSEYWSTLTSTNSSFYYEDSKLCIELSSSAQIASETACYVFEKKLNTGQFFEVVLIRPTNVIQADTSGPVLRLGVNGTTQLQVTLQKNYLKFEAGSVQELHEVADYNVRVRIYIKEDGFHCCAGVGGYGLPEVFVGQYTYPSDVSVNLCYVGANIDGIGKVYFDEVFVANGDDILVLEPASYNDRFVVTAASPRITNWFKLTEDTADYPDTYSSLVLNNTNVARVFDSSIGQFVAEFDNSLLKSSSPIVSSGTLSISLYVNNFGSNCSSTDVFGECQSILNIYESDTKYIVIGTTSSNTLYYKIKNSDATYTTDTGYVLNSGVYNNVILVCRDNDRATCYVNGSEVATISGSISTSVSGSLYVGGSDVGVGSSFNGRISDIKLTLSGALLEGDVDTIYGNGVLSEFKYAAYGLASDTFISDSNKPVFYGFSTYINDLDPRVVVSIVAEFGEAYNCYLTAWDDDTHSSTLNKVFDNQSLRISAGVYRIPSKCDSINTAKIRPSYSFVSNLPIKGDTLYYGKFPFISNHGITKNVSGDLVGDILVFRPRLSVITKDQFPPGVYDFVLTFHYQYT